MLAVTRRVGEIDEVDLDAGGAGTATIGPVQTSLMKQSAATLAVTVPLSGERCSLAPRRVSGPPRSGPSRRRLVDERLGSVTLAVLRGSVAD